MTADCHNVQSVCILIFMIISDREDIHCFEEESCYSMAFGMAMTVLTIAIITFSRKAAFALDCCRDCLKYPDRSYCEKE